MRNRDGVIIQPAAGIVLVVAVTALVVLSGCVSQQPAGNVTLEINPVIDYYPSENSQRNLRACL
jgi:ABC-type uncharacterized transport system auxiliary subunit